MCIPLFMGFIFLITDTDNPDPEIDINGSIRLCREHSTDYPAMTTISVTQAIQLSLSECKGKVLSAELKPLNGYLTFEVAVVGENNLLTLITLDAGTGEVLHIDKC